MKKKELFALTIFIITFLVVSIINDYSVLFVFNQLALIFGVIGIFCLNISIFYPKIFRKERRVKNIVFSLVSFALLLALVYILELCYARQFYIDWYYQKYTLCEIGISRPHHLGNVFYPCIAAYIFSVIYCLIKYRYKNVYTILTWTTSIALIIFSLLIVIESLPRNYEEPVIQPNEKVETKTYERGTTLDIDSLINNPADTGKIKILYFWTPSCGIFYSDMELINKISNDRKDIKQYFIAGECSKCNAEEWIEKVQFDNIEGSHIFLYRHQMEDLFFDELGLNGMPSVMVISKTNEILYKGKMRVGSFAAREKIDLRKIIDKQK